MGLASTLAAAAPVTLTTGNDYAPFAHSQLPGGGLATEVVRAALESQGSTLDVRWTSWTRAMEEAKEGKAAGTFPWFPTKERQAEFLYSEPIYEIREYAFTKPGSKLDFTKLDSLEGSTLCLPTGWAAPPGVSEMAAAGKIKRAESRDASSCLRMVLSGKADYFITDPFQGRDTMKNANMGEDVLSMSKTVLATRGLHLLVARSQPDGADLIKSFNTGLQAIKKNGKYEQIVARFAK
jgi:polar amino acid transport system substrate-binding protein